MKKILALSVAVIMTFALFAAAVNAAAEPALLITAEDLASESNTTKSGVSFELMEEGGEKFARFTAEDLDPHLYLASNPKTDVANHFAVLKYRTTSGAKKTDAFMAGAEPHTQFTDIVNDGQWHFAYGDLEESGANWTGTFARLDPLNNGDLKVGDTIDIAWIAVFANEADAQAYTGPAGSSEQPSDPQPVAEKDPDTWLCQAGDPAATTGWWMHPFTDKEWEFTSKFTTPNAFDGFIALFFANPEGAKVQINLLDEAGAVLDSQEFTQAGDGSPTIKFSKAFAAGTYTLQIKSTDTGAHFVVGSAHAGDVAVEVGGNCNTNDSTLDAPVIVLTGAVASGASEPSNPGTADASVIAIAAVACVALAGVVIAKKVR